MADRSETTTPQEEQKQQERPFSQIDSTFFEQMGGVGSPTSIGWDVTSQVVQSYFEQIEAQTRQARRMADLWAQSLILQQTTHEVARTVAPVVTKQVIEYLKSNPSLLKELSSSSR